MYFGCVVCEVVLAPYVDEMVAVTVMHVLLFVFYARSGSACRLAHKTVNWAAIAWGASFDTIFTVSCLSCTENRLRCLHSLQAILI